MLVAPVCDCVQTRIESYINLPKTSYNIHKRIADQRIKTSWGEIHCKLKRLGQDENRFIIINTAYTCGTDYWLWLSKSYKDQTNNHYLWYPSNHIIYYWIDLFVLKIGLINIRSEYCNFNRKKGLTDFVWFWQFCN